ncbi:discoidin domain-containing receptor 2-like [Porites lutea]
MTASTYYNSHLYPYYGRLNGHRGVGAWCPKTSNDRSDFLQVDMGEEYYVCAVATQGHKQGSHWAKSYKLQLSLQATTWETYSIDGAEKVFTGNSDKSTVVKNSLQNKIQARFVRFVPVTSQSYPCMRVEIFVIE